MRQNPTPERTQNANGWHLWEKALTYRMHRSRAHLNKGMRSKQNLNFVARSLPKGATTHFELTTRMRASSRSSLPFIDNAARKGENANYTKFSTKFCLLRDRL